MDQLAKPPAFVALGGRAGIEGGQTAEVPAAEHLADGEDGMAEPSVDCRASQALAAERLDRVLVDSVQALGCDADATSGSALPWAA